MQDLVFVELNFPYCSLNGYDPFPYTIPFHTTEVKPAKQINL